jgi:hypothetical protein
VAFVHQGDEADVALFVPGCSGFRATGVLGSGDDDEILIFEVFVNGLPT